MKEYKNPKQTDILFVIGRAILVLYIKIFYRLKVIGKENIPEGAAMLCANHSNSLDPVYICAATPWNRQIHFMAKKELFENKFIAKLGYALGAFPVNRQEADVSAIKTAFKLLKSGRKVGVFPEGTRTAADGDVQAKHGAIKIAERTGVPVVPIYIPRGKKIFRRHTVVVGTPFYVNEERRRLTNEEYDVLAEELMQSISALRPRD